MFKVLIIDDEFRIREGLKSIIEWEEYGIEIAGEASNGREALDLILKLKPNIIITDIKMPAMDGIELIKEIRNLGLNTRIVVLSGYDDFKLVKSAMKYGAENYLLKPVNSEELKITLSEIVDDLNKNIRSEIQIREGIKYLKNSTLNRVVKNEIHISELRDKMELLGINLYASKVCVALIEAYLPPEEIVESTIEDYNPSILSICEEFSSHLDCIIFTDIKGNIVFIFKNIEEGYIAVKEFLEKCIKAIAAACKIDINAYVGNIVDTHRDINLSYNQALESTHYKIVCGLNRVILFSEIPNVFEKKLVNLPIDFELIRNSIRTFNKNELIAYIDKFYTELIAGSGNPLLIRNITVKIIIQIINIMVEFKLDGSSELNVYDYTIFNRVSDADDVRLLKELVIETGCKTIAFISAAHNKKYSRLVSEAAQFIEKNYMQNNISLKILAYEMKVSATHLGRIFKAETGEYFSDYVNKVRVEKAKNLLLNTDIKINDIANLTGFNNNAYFYTIFKKWMNINPGDLRNVKIL
jgi:two-component system, response regulator YesN